MKQLAKENESKPKTKYEYKTSEFLPKKKITFYECNTKNKCLTHQVYTYRCFALNLFFDQF